MLYFNDVGLIFYLELAAEKGKPRGLLIAAFKRVRDESGGEVERR